MNKIAILLSYRKKIIIWLIIGGLIFTASYYGIPNAPRNYRNGTHRGLDFFANWGTPVRSVADGVGPMIIKIVSIPIFWILNALGTLVSGIAIKKGYATELAKGRIMTLALLIGMIIGYIIGNLIPLQ